MSLLYLAIGFALGYVTRIVFDVLKKDRKTSTNYAIRYFLPPEDGHPIPLPAGLYFDVIRFHDQDFIEVRGNHYAMAAFEKKWKPSVDPVQYVREKA